MGVQGINAPLILPTTMVTPTATVRQVAQWFPFGDTTGFAAQYLSAPGDIRMRRITLRSFPGSPAPMTLAQARQLFVSDDQLSMFEPDDPTFDPQQQLDPQQRKRQSDGGMSWMVTLTPKEHLQLQPAPVEQQLYIMSVVVFSRRDPAELTTENERVTRVQFHNLGYGGGDVTLYGNSEKSVDVQGDDWVMLAANSNVGRVFRWYRVLACDFEPLFNNVLNVWSREVTLQGPDWNRREWHYPPTPPPWPVQINAGYPAEPYVTNAILLRGVVGVYEKTVRLETSSLWSN